jgi:hypothetical protein
MDFESSASANSATPAQAIGSYEAASALKYSQRGPEVANFAAVRKFRVE